MSSRRSCKNKLAHKQNLTIETNGKKKINKIEKQNNNKKNSSRKVKVKGDQYERYAHYSGVESVNEKTFNCKNLQSNVMLNS